MDKKEGKQATEKIAKKKGNYEKLQQLIHRNHDGSNFGIPVKGRLPEHPPKIHLTLSQKLADKATIWFGSWTFIVLFLVFLVAWMLINTFLLLSKVDPYPYILLNLVLSMVSAIQAPIILISQNRAAERDRINAMRDYYINRKAERENLKIIINQEKIITLLERKNQKSKNTKKASKKGKK